MKYLSTRDRALRVTGAEAVKLGLSRDGGLLTPAVLPRLPASAVETMRDMSYQQRVVYIMNSFLEGFAASELNSYASEAYGGGKFSHEDVAPVRKLDENTYCLELWHGPTCAFKDMALQILPHLLTASLDKNDEKKTVCILVATSGDTGKAALEGFRNVENTKILVFYPKDGVSEIQELQMVTQEGGNVGVSSVVGNFDDAQAGVKQLFADEGLAAELAERGSSCPLPILSTGAGYCLRLCTTLPPTVICSRRALSLKDSRSMYACLPETSATFWRRITPRPWVSPSAG